MGSAANCVEPPIVCYFFSLAQCPLDTILRNSPKTKIPVCLELFSDCFGLLAKLLVIFMLESFIIQRIIVISKTNEFD